ncbi:MAG: 3-oxoacyl-ACP synthase [Myxococcales bacterium]|nr:3-oxoacyl-ACP synthase [Myxococcales bacterium]
MRAKVVGTGHYVPERVVTNADLEKIVDTNDEWIQTRTGIKTRRLVQEGEMATSDMAEMAARRALEDAGLTAEDLDMIVLGTVTPDHHVPAAACRLQKRLGAGKIPAFDLSAACAGSIFALSVGERFVTGGGYKRVLVVGGETMSSIVNWKDRNTCVLFGDAAGAAILEAGPADGPGIMDVIIRSDGDMYDVLYIPQGGSAQPITPEGLAAGEDRVIMKGGETFKYAVRTLTKTIKEVLERNNLTADDVSHVVAHQANMRIIEAVAQRLKVPMEKWVTNIQDYGNTSSASALVALDSARRSGNVKPGEIMVFAAIGAGFSWGAGVLRA